MKVNMTRAHFERNVAIQQVTRLRQEIDEIGRDRHAVSYSLPQAAFMLVAFILKI